MEKKYTMTNFDKRTEESKEWRKLYKTAQWLKGRAWFLRHNPLCVFCGEDGIATPATIVDHKIPHKGDKGLFYDTKNWQPLCKPCHDGIKQAMEKNDHKVQIGLDGFPITK